MSLQAFLQNMQQAAQQPTVGSRFLQGQAEGRALEDRQLQREQILREAEMKEDMFDVELQTKRAQLDALLAGPGEEDIEYDLKQDDQGNWVYIPKKPGAAGGPLATGITGPGLPEVQAKIVEQEAKEFEGYREKAQTNAMMIQDATHAVNAIKDGIEKGTEAGGPASWWREQAANFLLEFNVDPEQVINITNIDAPLKSKIDAALNNLAIGKLQLFKGPTTDFEFMKAAQVMGTTATTQEVILQVLKDRMESTVEWQKRFQELNQEHKRDFGAIARGMREFEMDQPMQPWARAVGREASPPADRQSITAEQLFEQTREKLKFAGNRARVLYDDVMGAVKSRPDLQQGIIRIPVPEEGRYIVLKDGVIVGSQPMKQAGN